MTQRHPPLRNPHREEVAAWHPIKGSPEMADAGRTVEATVTTTDGLISSGGPEGC